MIELRVAGSELPALVDDCWMALAGYKWRLDKKGYVYRKAGGKRIYLHHVVLPGSHYPALVRDHIHRDKLDNRAESLRWVTMRESAQNKGPQRRNKSGIRGAHWDKHAGRWKAQSILDGKTYAHGYFDDAELAGRAAAEFRTARMPFATP